MYLFLFAALQKKRHLVMVTQTLADRLIINHIISRVEWGTLTIFIYKENK